MHNECKIVILQKINMKTYYRELMKKTVYRLSDKVHLNL